MKHNSDPFKWRHYAPGIIAARALDGTVVTAKLQRPGGDDA